LKTPLVILAGLAIGPSLSVAADGGAVSRAITRLNKVAPGVTWSAAKARQADVTCDGKPDVILFGTSKFDSKFATIWMGVVSGKNGKPQVMRFPEARADELAFDTPPTRISVYPLDCEGPEGPLDGCRIHKGCKEFSFDSGETDAFHFYWDDRHKRVEWWRL